MRINARLEGGFNYHALSTDELANLVETDPDAVQFVHDNARDILYEVVDIYDHYSEFDYEQGRGDGFDAGYKAATQAERTRLADLYLEDLRAWLDRVPDMSLAGDGNLDELETLLNAVHEELSKT